MIEGFPEGAGALALASRLILHLVMAGVLSKHDAIRIVEESINPTEEAAGLIMGDWLREFMDVIDQLPDG